MTAIFLSDVHLRDGDSMKSKLVIRFLQEVASRYDRIFILGDLLDVWPGTSPFLIKTFQPVLNALKQLTADGHEVTYIEGNHDFRLGEYFSKELGIRVCPDGHEETWNGKKIYMVHGDLGNPKEVGYRALRFLLRRNILHTAIKYLPEDWVYRVGINTSKASRQYQSKAPKSEEAIRAIYRRSAEEIFKKGYDYVFMGHTHLPDDVTIVVNGRHCRYINLGDWVKHFSYLEFDGSDYYTKTHPVKDL